MFNYTLECTGAGGTASSSVSVLGYQEMQGVSVDGYIRSADIFIDKNNNFEVDGDETVTVSDNDGAFVLRYSDGNLISLGGYDLDTGNLLDNLVLINKLTGYAEFAAITPITTLASFMETPDDINLLLGIDASIDISSTDPVAVMGDGGVYDYLYEKGNQVTILVLVIQNIANDLNLTTDTSQDYFKAFAEELDAQFADTGEQVDIETSDFITNVVDNIIVAKALSFSEENRANVIAVLSAVIPVIEVKEDSATNVALFNFATSTLQADMQAVANGTASAAILNSYTVDVLTYIATDQNISSDDLTPNDVAPVFTSGATFSAAENQTSIGTVTATDSDSSSITFTVSGSELAITSGGVLSFASAPDYETKASYTATVTASDGSNETSQNITVNVIDVDDEAPVFTSGATFSAAENQTSIGTVTATDSDSSSITFTVSGSELAITPGGVLSFKTAADYETKPTYTATVTASDGTNTETQAITVNVSDANDNAPIIESSPVFSAVENQTSIGTVTATDADSSSITFTVSGSELAITSGGVLSFASAPDYETKASYTATVTASDGSNETSQNITVNVTDVDDEAPVFTSGATFSAAENQTSIGTVTATDSDSSSITFTVSGSELAITPGGVLSFKTAADYETKPTYTATVTASDGTNTETQAITVNVSDANDNAPIIESSPVFSAVENQTSIGTVTATDADSSSITFTVSGSELAITSGGVLSFASAPDYETKASYNATVTASDGSNETSQNITVNVIDVDDEAPVFTSGVTFSAAENQTSIGTVTATDSDSSSITFTVSGSELAITPGGVLSFKTAADYETKPTYTATVTASDGTNTETQAITVNVSDANDNAPIIESSPVFSAVENQTSIGTVTATDADSSSITFTVSGSELAITSGGVLSFASAPDYETKASYTATVTASDGTNTTTQAITVNVTNVNDNSPVFTSSATFSAAENQTSIGTVTATDSDSSSITFTVSGSELAITPGGVLSFKTAADYETKPTYTATVTASDGTNTETQAITVNVSDANDNAPIIESSPVFSAVENQTSIGTVTATDADSSSITFTVSGSELAITSGGVLSFASAPDYETKASYNATVTASDGSNETSQNITVNVIDVDDEAPVFTSGAPLVLLRIKHQLGLLQQRILIVHRLLLLCQGLSLPLPLAVY